MTSRRRRYDTRPGDDDPGAIELMHKLAKKQRTRWPEFAQIDEPKLVESLRLLADSGRRDPSGMLDVLRGQMTVADLRVVHDVMMRKLLADTYSEGLSAGPYGWIDDVLAFRRDWGFPLDAIRTRVGRGNSHGGMENPQVPPKLR